MAGEQLHPTVQPTGLRGAEYRREWNRLNRVRMRAHHKNFYLRHPEKIKKFPREVKERYRHTRRKKDKVRYYAGWEKAENRRTRWTTEETELLLSHTGTDRELSQVLGRSVNAIQKRRYLLQEATDGR